MIKVKKLYSKTRVAFGASGFSLSKRSQSELIDLGIIARESQDESLLVLFEELPALEELKRLKLGLKLKSRHDKGAVKEIKIVK